MNKPGALFALLVATAPMVFAADTFPSRPIRFLVPGATGSSQDLLARIASPG